MYSMFEDVAENVFNSITQASKRVRVCSDTLKISNRCTDCFIMFFSRVT